MRISLDEFLEQVPTTDVAGKLLTLVGGQCANFWACYYLERLPSLSRLRPYTSEDIDFLGTAEDARNAAQRAGRKVFLASMDDGGAGAGYYLAKISDRQHRVDFLNFLVNLSEDEATVGAVEVDYLGTRLRVLTPPALLQSKIGCLASLPQAARQDEKHVRIALLATRCYFEDMIQALRDGKFEERTVINSIKKMERQMHGRLAAMADRQAAAPLPWSDFLPALTQAKNLEKVTAFLESVYAKPKFSGAGR